MSFYKDYLQTQTSRRWPGTVNLFTAVISGLYYKSFTIVIYNYNDSAIVIYDHNDNGQYYKTMILGNLTLAGSVNYDCKVHCKLKHTLPS